jgi:hypothetical protein
MNQQTTMNNGSLTPNNHDDADNLINEEILRNNRNAEKDDDMYEGGEEDMNDVSNQNLNYRAENDDKELEGENDDGDDSTDDEYDFEAEGEEADLHQQTETQRLSNHLVASSRSCCFDHYGYSRISRLVERARCEYCCASGSLHHGSFLNG